MSNIVRIDKETFSLLAKNQQQLECFSVIFNVFNTKQLNCEVYFDYDMENSIYLTHFFIKNTKKLIEMPFLTKKNRKFYINNLIIFEKWLNHGENMIYILLEIILNLKDKITFEKIIENIKFFEFGDKK